VIYNEQELARATLLLVRKTLRWISVEPIDLAARRLRFVQNLVLGFRPPKSYRRIHSLSSVNRQLVDIGSIMMRFPSTYISTSSPIFTFTAFTTSSGR